MSTLTPTRIYNKLTRLEKELQLLKRQAKTVFPQKTRSVSRYQEKALVDAVRETRTAIWKERYAKKIARVH
jgi:hypothetical protein